MLLCFGGALLVLVLSNLLWKPPDPRYHTIYSQRIIEFVCYAPWLCWTITGWTGFLAWLLVFGDNESLFFDFFHYGTFAVGLGLAAILSFVLVRKSLVQWLCYVGFSLTMLVIITSTEYLHMLPSHDGFSAETAAVRIAHRRPAATRYTLVPTANPTIPKNAFSSFDRTYLLMGPEEAVGRVVVRPFLPFYWTQKRSENYDYAARELQRALRSMDRRELEWIIDKYPGSKVAETARKWHQRVGDPKFP